MQSAVARVEDVGDFQIQPLTDAADEPQRLDNLGARDHAILHVEARCDAAQSAERFLAAFPKFLPLLLRLGYAHSSSMAFPTNLSDLLGLRLHLLLQPFYFDQQHRSGIVWIARMGVVLDRLHGH